MRWLLLSVVVLSCRSEKLPGLNELQDIHGKAVALPASEFLVLNFYAPDCPPCIEELPELHEFHKKAGEAGAALVGLGSHLQVFDGNGVSDGEILRKTREFDATHGLEYPTHTVNKKMLDIYSVTGFPETLIYKKSGTDYQLMRRYVGGVDALTLLKELKRLRNPEAAGSSY